MRCTNNIALKVADLETATRFYETVFGFRQVKTGRSRGHVSRHLTDGSIDLARMLYDSEDDPEAKLVGRGSAIHHFGIVVADRRAVLDWIRANGGKSVRSRRWHGQVPLPGRHNRRDHRPRPL